MKWHLDPNQCVVCSLFLPPPSPERKVTLPFEGGYGFKVIGGNIVGLFVSEVRPSCREVSQGDQILEINGTDSRHMTHNEASQLLRSSYGPLSLVVMENCARE